MRKRSQPDKATEAVIKFFEKKEWESGDGDAFQYIECPECESRFMFHYFEGQQIDAAQRKLDIQSHKCSGGGAE